MACDVLWIDLDAAEVVRLGFVHGVAAASEAWIACDFETCGKWRRVPSIVAKTLADDARWRCADGKDAGARFSSCDAAQELRCVLYTGPHTTPSAW